MVITGLSGAGRSQAADDLEDLGWFVIDNLPTELIDASYDFLPLSMLPICRLSLHSETSDKSLIPKKSCCPQYLGSASSSKS